MKTRFAPSPTGYLHIGNIRTALFSALLAKSQNGIFLLRIEDTDRERSSNEFAEQLQKDLRWLGLDWQEGPDVNLGNGPYYQSQRQATYDEYYQRLEGLGQVYPCFCSEQQLAIARKVQLASGQPPRYPGTCRNLTQDQIEQKLAQGLKPTLRFRVPDNQVVEFVDFVRGPHSFPTAEIGDFIIRRTDGTPPFFFCNAIDDAKMGVTHVLRGEDHLTNTPRQLLILQALDLPKPAYGHLALILGPDNTPLSKRHGSRSIKELSVQGYLSQALINYMARLGHYYANNDLMDSTQLAANFKCEHLSKSPAHFDATQLLHWQKQAVLHLTKEQVWYWLSEETKALVSADERDLFIEVAQANSTFPEEALHWAKIFFTDSLDYNIEAAAILQSAGKAFVETAIQAVNEYSIDFKAVSRAISQALNIKGKALFQPLRVALTGQIDSPEMIKIFELLGKERILQRLGNL